MRKFYPGWVMRVYTDVVADSEICSVVCVADDVYFCNMSENLWGIATYTKRHVHYSLELQELGILFFALIRRRR